MLCSLPGLRHWTPSILVAVLTSLLIPSDLIGQTPSTQRQAPPDDTIRISTNLVQIDVIVTDGKGNHVTDLKPEDFVIEVDGRQHPVSYFQPITQSNPARASSVRNAEKNATAGAAPAARGGIRPEQVKRSIAFIFDDYFLAIDSFVRSREAARRFINEQVQEGDLVAIIQTGKRFNNLQRFTTDRRTMLHALNKLTWIPPGSPLPGLGGLDAAASPDSLVSPADESDAYRTLGRSNALRHVSRALRDLPGRKLAILFSDGFQILPPGVDSTRALEQIRRVTDEAHRGGVAFYTIEAKGLTAPSPNSGPITFSPNAMGRLPSNDYYRRELERIFREREGLIFLARETGGLSITGSNDIPNGLLKFIRDNESYYLLGFDPDQETFDGKFRSLKVKVNRRGLTARTRSGFLGRADEARIDRPKTRNEEITDIIFSPFAARELPIELTALYFADAERKPVIRTMVQIDAAPLAFQPGENGKLSTTLELIAITFDDNGKPAEQQERNFTITLDQAALERVRRDGLVYQSDFTLSKPGFYHFHTVLREISTHRMGASSQLLEIPDLSRRKISLSGIVVAGTSGDVNDSPSLRRFARNSEVQYGAVAYVPQSQTPGPRKLYSQIEIYRDGQVVHKTPPRPVQTAADASDGAVDIGGRLILGELEPGDYHLRLIVSDPAVQGKTVSADQWITFTVRQ
jgi:VWFA-related protein